MLSPVRLTAHHLFWPTHDQSKMVEVRIMKFSPYLAPSLWLLRGEFHPEILTGFPTPSNGIAGETSHFLVVSLNVNMSKTVGDMSKVTINA